MIKVAFIAVALLGLGCQRQFILLEPTGDCRPHVEIKMIDAGKKTAITFYQNLSEVVSGQVNCDFAYRPIMVDKAAIGGKPLTFAERGGSPSYTSDGAIDMTNPAISFEWNGTPYTADLTSVLKHDDDSVTVRVQQFPPK